MIVTLCTGTVPSSRNTLHDGMAGLVPGTRRFSASSITRRATRSCGAVNAAA